MILAFEPFSELGHVTEQPNLARLSCADITGTNYRIWQYDILGIVALGHEGYRIWQHVCGYTNNLSIAEQTIYKDGPVTVSNGHNTDR